MRSRLMAYTRGMPGGRHLREKLSHVTTLQGLCSIAADHLQALAQTTAPPEPPTIHLAA
jgi:hypothetical protein